MDGHAISFGPFRLLAEQRLLLEGDTPVRLGSRAFDILAALVERAGEVVGKEELIARTWPQTFVETRCRAWRGSSARPLRYSAEMRPQVNSRYSSPASVWRGG